MKLEDRVNILKTKTQQILHTTQRELHTNFKTNQFIKLEDLQTFIDRQEDLGTTHIKLTEHGIEVAKVERMTPTKYINHLKRVKEKAEKEIRQDINMSHKEKDLYISRIKNNFEIQKDEVKRTIKALKLKS